MHMLSADTKSYIGP